MIATVKRRMDWLERTIAGWPTVSVQAPPELNPVLHRLREDPAQVMTLARITPDLWQTKLLRSNSRQTLLLASRQVGKSTTVAALALKETMTRRCLVLLLSPSLRQSGELFRKVLDLFNALGRPLKVAAESALRLELANGSRIVSLPGDEGTIRGYSGVSLLVIDEAARVPDDLYRAVRPMLAVSGGRLIALSTPFGKRGFFYDSWVGPDRWERIQIDAYQCPRITPEFLQEERIALGERWFRQEYRCSFEDVIGAVFSQADINAAMVDGLQPWLIA